MPEKHIFEYAAIRVVPRVERGEFMNVGVVLFCKGLRYLDMKYAVDANRLLALHEGIDLADIHCHLASFRKICLGDPAGGPIALLDQPSRFRWLTAKRSTILQSSAVHPGLCDAPNAMLDRLFSELVEP
jgi:hypothetical protein